MIQRTCSPRFLMATGRPFCARLCWQQTITHITSGNSCSFDGYWGPGSSSALPTPAQIFSKSQRHGVHRLSLPFYDGYLLTSADETCSVQMYGANLLAQEKPIQKAITGKTILLTGAGGFIGSALAAAIVPLKPGHLILLDHSERNLNEIDLKLAATTARDLYTSVLGDICDIKLLSEVLQRYRPR